MTASFSLSAAASPQFVDLLDVAAGVGVVSVPVGDLLPGDTVNSATLSIEGTGLTTISATIDFVQRTQGYMEYLDSETVDCRFSLTAAQLALIAIGTSCTYEVSLAITRSENAYTREVQSGNIGVRSALPSSPLIVASIDIDNGPAIQEIGQTVQLSAIGYDGFGDPVVGAVFAWASSNEAIATVSSTGLVTITGLGTCTISASAYGVSAYTTASATSAPWAVLDVIYAATTSQLAGLHVGTALQMLRVNAGVTALEYHTLVANDVGAGTFPGAYTFTGSVTMGALTTLAAQALTATTISASSTGHFGGDFDVATNKFTVAAASGNTLIAGTLGVTGALTLTVALTTANGGTGLSSYAAGDLPYYAAGTLFSKLAIGTAGQHLRSTGTAPAWSTSTMPDTAVAGDMLYASATNVWSNRTIGSASAILQVSGGFPGWTLTPSGLTSIGATTGTFTNVAGTLTTAAQPNITSVGILASPHMTSPVVDSGGLTVTLGGLTVSSGTTAVQAFTATTGAFSALLSANAGLTVASGQTLTLTGATITGLTAASVGSGTFPSGTYGFTGATALTGGAGNMTLLAGTGASRTLILQATSGASAATTNVTLSDTTAVFNTIAVSGVTTLVMTGAAGITATSVTAAGILYLRAFAGSVVNINDLSNGGVNIAVGGGAMTFGASVTLSNAGAFAGITTLAATTSVTVTKTTASDPYFATAGSVTGDAWVMNLSNAATAKVLATINNTSAGASASATQNILVVAATGDAYTRWGVTGVTDWSAGIDNSDSDSFKISSAETPSDGNTWLKITTAGLATFANTVTVTTGGLTVSAGTTAVQAFTATTGAFSSTVSGTTWTGTGLIQTTVTTEQMRLRYDASNYLSITVGSSGGVTFDSVASGTPQFFFNDKITASVSATISTSDNTRPLLITGGGSAEGDMVKLARGGGEKVGYFWAANNAKFGVASEGDLWLSTGVTADQPNTTGTASLKLSTTTAVFASLALSGVTSLAGTGAVSGFTSATLSSFMQARDIYATGTRQNNTASSTVLENNAGLGALSSMGPDTSTNGTLNIYSLRSNGSSSVTMLALTTVAATFPSNVLIGGSVGATAAKTVALSNSATAPTTSVDLVHLYSADISAGNASLAIYSEGAVNAAVAVVSTHRYPVTINGTQYAILLTTVLA